VRAGNYRTIDINQATGLRDMWSADRGSILEVQQNGNNWYASTVAGGLGQTTSPRWSNTYHPNITQVTGPTATRTADRGSILETEQD
jgi:hypothetical protein